MAGMLPGVELARRRRTHHHLYDCNSREPCLHQRRDPSTTMDETALMARRRLEEKLRGFASSRWSKKDPNNMERRSSNHAAEAKDTHMGVARLERWSLQLDKRNSQRDVCVICLDDLRTHQQVMNLPCSHKYHSDCLRPWLTAHSHCPCCRTHVQSS